MRIAVAYAACLAIALGVTLWLGRPGPETGPNLRSGGWLPADQPLGKVLE